MRDKDFIVIVERDIGFLLWIIKIFIRVKKVIFVG